MKARQERTKATVTSNAVTKDSLIQPLQSSKHLDSIGPIDSAARKGDSVARRRFQHGSVYQNKSKTQWLGMYAEYVLDAQGIEKRIRKQVILSPTKTAEGTVSKRQAEKLLQPYVDRVNASISSPARERKNVTLDAFLEIWERDYLSLYKPSTQSSMRVHLRRIKAIFGKLEMREIGAGHIQQLISRMQSEGTDPKSIRNVWATIRLIWDAALAQKYVDAQLPKPKLPKKPKVKAKFFTLPEVAKIINASQGEHKVFYWLAAETGLRAGELAGLKLTDIDGEKLTVNQSVWHSKEQDPKTDNARRTLALSPQLIDLLWEQIARQKAKSLKDSDGRKGHEFLFSASTGSPWDMNLFRKRKLSRLLTALGIGQKGFHAFRHFSISLMDSLHIPLTVNKERAGHATGDFTVDVYGQTLDWSGNREAAQKLGAAIAQAVAEQTDTAVSAKAENFVHLTAIAGQVVAA